jgi:hypothetical protein
MQKQYRNLQEVEKAEKLGLVNQFILKVAGLRDISYYENHLLLTKN